MMMNNNIQQLFTFIFGMAFGSIIFWLGMEYERWLQQRFSSNVMKEPKIQEIEQETKKIELNP